MTSTLPLLATLQSHAALHGEAFAHLLPDRVITYRRFWSRIERAAARLQGEWGIQADESVAYLGNGHPDALVLYCALLRLGASLLPLEGLSLMQAQPLLQQAKVKLIVHDDEALTIAGIPARALSLLLADWCHFDPAVVEDHEQRAGLLIPQKKGDGLELHKISLQQLSQMPATLLSQNRLQADEAGVLVGPTVFDLPTLSGGIIPALMAAQPMRFTVIEACLQKRLRKAS